MKDPRVSIITVVYNDKEGLQKTFDSIFSQTYPHIEYLVVDGASTDGTAELIRKNSERISRFVSEPDSGLYDAMNKGLAMATGEYVWFMNAGDTIPEKQTLEKIISSGADADVFYGDTAITDKKGNVVGSRRLRPPSELTWKSFRMGMLVGHQAILFKRSLCRNYDLTYKVSADIDWVISSLRRCRTIVNTGMVLCHFEGGGISRQRQKEGNRERFRIMVKHYGFFTTVFFHVLILFRFLFHRLSGNRL